MNKKLLFLSFSLILSFFSGNAQTQLSGAEDGYELTLQECINYALEHNITLRQNELKIENSLVQLNQAKGKILPSVNGQTNLNTNFGRNIDPFSNEIVTQTIGTNSLGLGANMTLYNGLKLKNTVTYNTLDLQAARMDLAAQKNAISMQIAIAYLNVLSAEDMIEVSKKNLETTRLQLDRTERMAKAGSVPESNLFDLNAQLANDELNLVNAQNQLLSTTLALTQAMNFTENQTVQVSRVNIPDLALQPYSENAMQIYDAAINFLPEIDAAEIREQMAIKNIEIAKSVGLPVLTANASYGTTYSTAAKSVLPGETTYNPTTLSAEIDGQTVPLLVNFPQQGVITKDIPYFNQLGNNKNFNIGLSLQIPIFNGFNKKYQVQSAKIQEMQSKLSTENTKLTIRQNIEQAYIDMLNSSKSFSANMAQVEALEKSFIAAESRYNAGASTFVDYNLSKTNLDRAKANLIQAKYNYLFRTKILDFYQNKPLAF